MSSRSTNSSKINSGPKLRSVSSSSMSLTSWATSYQIMRPMGRINSILLPLLPEAPTSGQL